MQRTNQRYGLAFALGCAGVTLIAAACTTPDPEGVLIEGRNEFQDVRSVPEDIQAGGCLENEFDFSGSYLFALAAILDPDKPLLLQFDISNVDYAGGSFDVQVQPLQHEFDPSSGDPDPLARQPVGDVLNMVGSLNTDNTFEIAIDGLVIVGEANGISGSEIEANVVLEGTACNFDHFCGGVTGTVFRPLTFSLDGSTFGANRIGDDETIFDIEVAATCIDFSTGEDVGVDVPTDVIDDGDTTPVVLMDVCLGEADQTILGSQPVSDLARSCGLGCLGNADETCAQTCVEEDTGLSSDCSSCYADTVACTVDNCLAACAANPSSDGCIECQIAEGCLNEFYSCTGGPFDACRPPADYDLVTDAEADVTGEARSCGLGCLGNADESCAQVCVQDNTGVSYGCSICYAGTVACTVDNCLAECAADPSSDGCVACQGEFCLDDFYLCTGGPFDLCVNDADLGIIATADPSVTSVAGDCGLGCIADPDSAACAADCVVTATGITAGCSTCYGSTVACTIDNCLAACGADPSSEGCGECQATFCTEDFFFCSGLPRPVVDACINDDDQAIITDVAINLDDESATCLTTCDGDTDPTCIDACINTAVGLTIECSGCYANDIECRTANCGTECDADPDGVDCTTCMETNCDPAFEFCAGTAE